MFSKARDSSIIKSEAKPIILKGKAHFCLETFDRAGKAFHKNIKFEDAPTILSNLAQDEYRQTNILTSNGECILLISKKGKATLQNNIKENAKDVKIPEHDRKRNI